MISFFKKKETDMTDNNESFLKITALLIHAAKIDEIYTVEEEKIIIKTLLDLGAKSTNIDKLISDATLIEENANQILGFTREIKSIPESDRIKIIESLWKIIYSNNSIDVYEANLMRRLAGLLYVDAKTMGNLKEKIKKELLK
jgi:uncharacterized tellurite resistance protein B-like protein